MNLTVQEAALAWARGKRVEIQLVTGTWVEIPTVGQDVIQRPGWLLGANVFNTSHYHGPFRLAPGETMQEAKPEPVDDGRPAYPVPSVGTGDPRDGMTTGHNGMTLRAYLASRETLADFDNPDATMPSKLAEAIAGPKPTDGWGDQVAMFAWQARVRAGMKVIRADALLAELGRAR